MKVSIKNTRILFPLSIILLLLFLSLCTLHIIYSDNSSNLDRQKLEISVISNNSGDFKVYTIASNYSEILFNELNFDTVSIKIHRKSMSLREALCDKYISIDELLAYARTDSRNGFCSELHRTQNGLTEFIYTYPDFEFCVIYDVADSNSGQTKIENYLLCPPGDHKSVTHSFRDESGKNILGDNSNTPEINFAIENICSTGIEIKYECQPDSKRGVLNVEYYTILDKTQNSFCPHISDSPIKDVLSTIENTEDGFIIDWSTIFGTLTNGSYELIFQVNEMHDDVKNNASIYSIDFTID